jgi:hypothetical protein
MSDNWQIDIPGQIVTTVTTVTTRFQKDNDNELTTKVTNNLFASAISRSRGCNTKYIQQLK